MAQKRAEMIGLKFGRLTVVSFNSKNERRQLLWNCKCECGNKNVVAVGAKLREGSVVSCGCHRSERMIEINKNIHKTHGKSYSRLNKIWSQMKQRCYNAKANGYKDYGGRGIRICDEWLNSLENFYEWAINNGYDDNLTIDRIDVNGNYEPSNCRWITMEEQQWNKRNTKYVTINNETKTIKDWSEENGISAHNIWYRLSQGYEGEDLIKPVSNKKAIRQSGEKYVTWNNSNNAWVVRVKRKYIGSSKDLTKAIEIRDHHLMELNISERHRR